MAVQVPESFRGAFDAYPLYRLTRAVASARRPEDIYEAALLCLRDSLGVQRAGLLLADSDGVMRFQAWLNLSAGFRTAVEGVSPWQPGAHDPAPVVLEDVETDQTLRQLQPALAAEGVRALAFLPLLSAEHLTGQLVLYYAAPHAFGNAEVLLAQTITSQVAFAIEQRHAEAERRLSEALLAGQERTLELLASGSPLPEVLTSLVSLVEELSEGGALASLQLVDSAGRLRNGAAPSLPDAYLAALDGLPGAAGQCSVAACAARGEQLIARDLAADPSWQALAPLALANGLRAVWSQPVFARDGNVIGVFSTYYREPHMPTADERQIVEGLAQTAAIAIESARAEPSWHPERAHVEATFRSAVNGLVMQSITDNLSVGLLMLDRDGNIEFMNPAAERITGLRFEDVQGQSAHTWMHHHRPDGTPYDEADCPIIHANQSLRRLSGHEDVFVRPDGRFYDVVCNAAPLLRDGVRLGAILDFRDVTSEKRAEHDLRRSEENLREAAVLKDQFLGLVSHELRTPIATILGNGLLLTRRGDQLQREDREQALLDIVSEAHKLQEIIENLLLLTRLEAGQLELEPLLLPHLAHAAIGDFQKLNPARVVSLTVEQGLPPALGQPTLVSLVLRNLLSNAGKYSPLSTPIELRIAADEAGRLRTDVRDHGIGLDAQDLENAFVPFYRSPRAREQAKGMGLGLAVCKRIIEAQAGNITVASPADGGAWFCFTLQAADGTFV